MPGPMLFEWSDVCQSPNWTGWQAPQASGCSERSIGEKRSGAGPCGGMAPPQ